MVDKTEMKVVGRAWGLLEPVGFGKYFPYGEYIGWREKVLGCPHAKGKTPVDLTYEASRKFTRNLGPLHKCEMPEIYRTKKTYKELASMILLPNRLVAVDENLKSLIEKFEPGVHQFFPLRIEMPRGKVYPKTYYGLIILNWRDSFVPVLSKGVEAEKTWRGEFLYYSDDRKKAISQLYFFKEDIGSTHLWRECRMRRPNIFMSDELVSAIEAAGLSIFRHYPVRLV